MRQWILDRWREYARVSLMLAIFIPPVVFWRETVDVFNLVKITVLLVFGSAALIFWVSYSAESRLGVPRFRLALVALIFLLACAVATVFSENALLSITGLYHRYGGLVPFALYAGLMVVIVGMYWDRVGDLRDIAKASAGASVLMTAYCLIQEAGRDWISWRDASGGPPPFPVGTMGNSNFAGGYLGIALPFLIFMALTARKDFRRALLSIAVGADVLALWFTQTRGGMIAGAAGILTMIVMYRDRLPRWTKVSAALGLGVVTVLAAVVLTSADSRADSVVERINVFRTDTLDVRTYYWGTAWRIFLDHPIIGTGLETYYANYPKYRLAVDGRRLGLTITDKPHNIFLEYAANSGLAGFGSYLALLGLGLWYGIRMARKLEGEQRLLLTSFVAVLVAYAGQGIFSIDVPPLAVMSWVALGGIAAFADPGAVEARARLAARRAEAARGSKGRKVKRGRGERQVLQGPLRWQVHAAGFIGAAVLLILGVRPLIADVAAKDGQALEGQRADDAKVVEEYKQAVRLHPFEPSYRVQVGAVSERIAGQSVEPREKIRHLREALRHYTDAYNLQPGNVFYMMNIGRVYAIWGEYDVEKFKDADVWWRRAVTHDATDWEVHNRYALMLNSWANVARDPEIRAKAARELETSVSIKPDHAVGWLNLGKIYRALGRDQDAVEALNKAISLDPSLEEARDHLRAMGEAG